MSELAVRVEKVVSVEKHPNADRLDLIQVLDWRCVAGRDSFRAGDLCVYFPIDSILPAELEAHLFSPDAKVKLTKGRIRTIKLRGSISQGMAVDVPTIGVFLKRELREGDDLTAALGVKKYEPPAAGGHMATGNRVSRKAANPYFHKYTDIQNAKNHPNYFEAGEEVVITEKVHGTNFRAGWVPYHPTNLWGKLKQFFGLAPKVEFVYGSHNVQLQNPFHGTKQFYKDNVYAKVADVYGLRIHIDEGYVVYGEIYGDGIQKGYLYDCLPGQVKLVIFDVSFGGKYLDFDVAAKLCRRWFLPFVTVLARGPWVDGFANGYIGGDSVMAPGQKIREGVVVKPVAEGVHHQTGRRILKYINPEYLLGDQTEHH